MRNDDALFQLGMDLEALNDFEPRSTTQTEDFEEYETAFFGNNKPQKTKINDASMVEKKLDHFINEGGDYFAGSHIIIDLYDAEGLNDQNRIEKAMLNCIREAGATLLHIHLHPFEPTGISGVAVLAESHISVHTWPEVGYAAFDVFMCGDACPEKCINILGKAFNASRVEVKNLKRGTEVLDNQNQHAFSF